MSGKNLLVLLFCVCCLLLSGCFSGTNVNEDVSGPDGYVAGFWMGLWHGFIAPLSWLISLFDGRINVYETHNNGGWYDFGFLLGCGSVIRFAITKDDVIVSMGSGIFSFVRY